MIFDQFDKVRVISLPERGDRRAQIRNVLKRFGIAPSFFDAIRPDNAGRFASIGFRGSYLSHLAVLQEGGRVLILEDDCAFIPEAIDFRAPDCDIFYGSHAEDGDMMIGAHCMGFSAKAARLAAAYLAGLLDHSIAPDPLAAAQPGYDPAILPPIDGVYVWFRRAHPELTVEFAEISYQRPSRSDCTPGRFDTIPILRTLAGAARTLR